MCADCGPLLVNPLLLVHAQQVPNERAEGSFTAWGRVAADELEIGEVVVVTSLELADDPAKPDAPSPVEPDDASLAGLHHLVELLGEHGELTLPTGEGRQL